MVLTVTTPIERLRCRRRVVRRVCRGRGALDVTRCWATARRAHAARVPARRARTGRPVGWASSRRREPAGGRMILYRGGCRAAGGDAAVASRGAGTITVQVATSAE